MTNRAGADKMKYKKNGIDLLLKGKWMTHLKAIQIGFLLVAGSLNFYSAGEIEKQWEA